MQLPDNAHSHFTQISLNTKMVVKWNLSSDTEKHKCNNTKMPWNKIWVQNHHEMLGEIWFLAFQNIYKQ